MELANLEEVFKLFNQWIHWPLATVIVLSSMLIKKLLRNRPKFLGKVFSDTWLIFFWSTFVALIYGVLEKLSGTFQNGFFSEYLVTYLFATNFYSHLIKIIQKRIGYEQDTDAPDTRGNDRVQDTPAESGEHIREVPPSE